MSLFHTNSCYAPNYDHTHSQITHQAIFTNSVGDSYEKKQEIFRYHFILIKTLSIYNAYICKFALMESVMSLNLSESYKKLQKECQERILVLDGAFGTMIQRLNLTEADFRSSLFKDHPVDLKGNNDVLCLTAPHHVQNIHRLYLEAGADIIETNTFGANRLGQLEYHLADRAYDIAHAGAVVAKRAVEEFNQNREAQGLPSLVKFVAGSIGPTSKTASMSPDVSDPAFRAISFEQLAADYGEQVRGLLDGGVDILLVEDRKSTRLNSSHQII